MKSNYKRLGDYIRQVDVRNKDLGTSNLLGINIDKFFMPSVANIIGTDLRNYKLIRENQFACNPMHVGRDERIPVALYLDKDKAIVSPAYFVFEIVRNELLMIGNVGFILMRVFEVELLGKIFAKCEYLFRRSKSKKKLWTPTKLLKRELLLKER